MTDTPPPYLHEKNALPILDKAMGELAVLFGYLHRHKTQWRLGKCLDELSKIKEELSND